MSCRKRWKAIKVGHSCCYLPRARSCGHLRQSTKRTWSLNLWLQAKPRRATAEMRFRLFRIAQPTHILNPRARVCGISLEAKGQGDTRVGLIVADTRKSAPARGWNGKMAMLLRFVPFRAELQVQLAPMKCQRRETAQTAKTLEGQCCGSLTSPSPPPLSDSVSQLEVG